MDATTTSTSDLTPTRRPGGRVRRTAMATLMALGLVIGLAACDNRPADCTKDCIDLVSLSPTGQSVTVALNGAANVEMTIYSDSARTKPVGYARNFVRQTSIVGMDITKKYQGLPQTNPELTRLNPGTMYYWRILATDPKGNSRWEMGMAKTWTRTITLTVNSIELYDDSDLSGSGEIRFDMRVNGGASSRIYQNLDMSSGAHVKNLNIVRTYTTLPPEISIQVRGQDDDCEFSTCTTDRWDTGQTSDVGWATGTVNLNLPPGSGGAGGDGTWLAQGDGGGIGKIGFRVYGSWSVRYYPA